jgi:hypothetical protein
LIGKKDVLVILPILPLIVPHLVIDHGGQRNQDHRADHITPIATRGHKWLGHHAMVPLLDFGQKNIKNLPRLRVYSGKRQAVMQSIIGLGQSASPLPKRFFFK